MCGASRVISANASRARSPPESLPTFCVARKPEKPNRPSCARTAPGVLPAHHPRHMFERRIVTVEFLDLILREVSDPHLARRRHRTIHCGQLRGEQPSERSLAVAVASEQRDAVVRVEPQVQPLQDWRLGIADRRHVERDERGTQFIRGREIERQRRILRHRGDRLHLRQHLLPALRLLRGRGAGGILGDIFAQFGALCVLRGLRGGELRDALGTLALETVVPTSVKIHLATFEVEDRVDDVVQQDRARG